MSKANSGFPIILTQRSFPLAVIIGNSKSHGLP
ncbi:type II toxin-antitoxin system prevent-host-death family antitoxin [Arenibacter sp. M-2]